MTNSARALSAYLSYCFGGANHWQRERREPAKLLERFLADHANSPNDQFGNHPNFADEVRPLSFFEAWILTHDVDGPTMASFLARGADAKAGGLCPVAFRIMHGSDDPEPIEQLLDAGLPLDATWSIHGWTLFHQAAVFGSQERKSRMVPMLIERAVRVGRLDLLEAQSNRNDNVSPSSPMDIALQVGNWDTVRQFCAHVSPSSRVQAAARSAKASGHDVSLA